MSRLMARITVQDRTPVEDIQELAQEALMKEGAYKAAAKFITYREEHKKARLLSEKLQYMYKYMNSSDNAANLSNTDDNANASLKTAATLKSELYKDTARLVSRACMKEFLKNIKSQYRDDFVKDLDSHIIYQHDEQDVPLPYCSAYTLYPLVCDGTDSIDGTKNKPPKRLSSFCGQFCNLVFLLSAQKKGAGAYGEFFNFFSWYCVKEWGEDYYLHENDYVTDNSICKTPRTVGDIIDQHFQQVTYYINQPAQNRGVQSPFTNFNVFDSYYWHAMFDGFRFPDGTQPDWNAVSWLQKRYMRWLNIERTKTLLTFPVMTVCLLTDGTDVRDKDYKDFVTTQWAEGDSFFVYLSQNADSLSSCCRLRNEITDNTFSSTTGLTGVQTGSCNVFTLNLNRIAQDWSRSAGRKQFDEQSWKEYLQAILLRVYDYHKAYKTGLYMMDERGLFPQTKAGYISLDRLYCTIGVNGLNEAARFFGYEVTNNSRYMSFAAFTLSVIKDFNKAHSEKRFRFNLELVPAESLGVKNCNWDRQDGYWTPDDVNLYNSYIYDAHNPQTSVLDMIAMQGGEIARSIDGGQASHINLSENLSKKQYERLLEYAVRTGNSYITFNVPQTQCDSCGFIAKHPLTKCPKCGSESLTQWTRIIGYLRPVKAWSEGRQKEFSKRVFHAQG